ncbi:MAG: hypothetical protein AB7V16_05580 [Vulcanibacillus sp.]
MNTLFDNVNFRVGTIIKGTWNKKEYKVLKILGSGENGMVYLVEYLKTLYALKISLSYFNLNSEINNTKKLEGAQGAILGFKVFDFDDFTIEGNTYSFYVMPYEEGIPINKYLRGRTAKEYLIIFKKVVETLDLLHQKGWIFGDIKPEHILINQDTKNLKLIDLGGITRINESVKQYTEFYDRGNWKTNNRKADPHYDLFSLSMVFVHISIGINDFAKLYNQKLRITKFCGIIQNIDALKYLYPIIKEILYGRLRITNDVLKEIEKINNSVDQRVKHYSWINYLFTSSLLLFIVIVVYILK